MIRNPNPDGGPSCIHIGERASYKEEDFVPAPVKSGKDFRPGILSLVSIKSSKDFVPASVKSDKDFKPSFNKE